MSIKLRARTRRYILKLQAQSKEFKNHWKSEAGGLKGELKIALAKLAIARTALEEIEQLSQGTGTQIGHTCAEIAKRALPDLTWPPTKS